MTISATHFGQFQSNIIRMFVFNNILIQFNKYHVETDYEAQVSDLGLSPLLEASWVYKVSHRSGVT